MSTPLEAFWEKNSSKIEELNNKVWDTVWKDGVAEIYIDAQKTAARDLGSDISFNPKEVMKYYREHGMKLVKTLSETDKNTFKEILDKNFDLEYEEFKNIDEIRDMIDNSFISSESRIKTIWNTERHTAYTNGYDDYVRKYAKDNNVKIKKMWHHSGNPHPRLRHLEMDGIVVNLHDEFPNGESVPEGINCGCWLEYFEE